jgi:putative DNA-invertase from lambdoid prophage Rac
MDFGAVNKSASSNVRIGAGESVNPLLRRLLVSLVRLVIHREIIGAWAGLRYGRLACPKTNGCGQVRKACPKTSLRCFGQNANCGHRLRTGRTPMPRTFAYLRVSTTDQTTDNQVREIAAAGFTIDHKRIISETVSGSSAVEQRPGFMRLLDRLEAGDVLVVTKLDRLGRNAIDVTQTVARLEAMGVRVHCLALGGVDLTSAAGKMTMGVIAHVAQFERDLLIERTHAGLERAKAEGASLGRPTSLDTAQRVAVLADLAAGVSVSEAARRMGVSRQTIMRARDAA